MTYHEHVKAALEALVRVNPDLRHTSKEEAIDHLREAVKLEYTLAEEIDDERKTLSALVINPDADPYSYGMQVGVQEGYAEAAEALGLPTKAPTEPTR